MKCEAKRETKVDTISTDSVFGCFLLVSPYLIIK